MWLVFVFLNDTATTEIYALSLHDALPIYRADLRHRVDRRRPRRADRARHDRRHPARGAVLGDRPLQRLGAQREALVDVEDRKSTRLNSSHANISYAVFCLKKKKFGRNVLG